MDNHPQKFMTSASKIAINAAEEYFNLHLFDAAIKSAEAAKALHPDVTAMADNFIAAYRIHNIVSVKKRGSLYQVLDVKSSLDVIKAYRIHVKKQGSFSLYDVIGILDVKESVDVIKRQYKRTALILHPDKNKSIAADRAFKIVSEAWDVLSDETKRRNYDLEKGYRTIDDDRKNHSPPNNNRKRSSASDRQQAGAGRRCSSSSTTTRSFSKSSSSSGVTVRFDASNPTRVCVHIVYYTSSTGETSVSVTSQGFVKPVEIV